MENPPGPRPQSIYVHGTKIARTEAHHFLTNGAAANDSKTFQAILFRESKRKSCWNRVDWAAYESRRGIGPRTITIRNQTEALTRKRLSPFFSKALSQECKTLSKFAFHCVLLAGFMTKISLGPYIQGITSQRWGGKKGSNKFTTDTVR